MAVDRLQAPTMLAMMLDRVEIDPETKEARAFARPLLPRMDSLNIPDWHSFEPFASAFVEPLAPHLLAARRLAA